MRLTLIDLHRRVWLAIPSTPFSSRRLVPDIGWQSNHWDICIRMKQLHAVRLPNQRTPRILTERGAKHAFTTEYELFVFANKHGYKVVDPTSKTGSVILSNHAPEYLKQH